MTVSSFWFALAGTDLAVSPFFSPDGQWIGFVADQRMKKVSVTGGPVQTICDVPATFRGAAWLPDDTIVLSHSGANSLLRVPAAGGSPTPFTTPDKTKREVQHVNPEMLPDGKTILFASTLAGQTRSACTNVSV